jgi:hypothetical protein
LGALDLLLLEAFSAAAGSFGVLNFNFCAVLGVFAG